MKGSVLRTKRRRAVRALLLALTTALGPAGLHCGPRQDESRCEEALGLVRNCCPGVNIVGAGCVALDTDAGVTLLPVLSVAESDCLSSLSCEAMQQASGVGGMSICARVQARLAAMRPPGGAVPPGPAVCP